MLRKVQTSCGFGVPLLTTAPSSEDEKSGDETKPVLIDRDTMGHWAHRKIETNSLLEYQAHNNSSSLDGCPGMRSAMRDQGDVVWFKLAKARIKRMARQTDAVFFGIVVGMAILTFAHFIGSIYIC